jgi:hypothetical protein
MKAYVALIFVLVSVACAGTSEPPGPRARPGEKVTGWTEELSWRTGKDLFLRNNTNGPVFVTFITLMACENVKGGCVNWDPQIMLGPGEWQRVKTILPARDADPFHFQWQWGSSNVGEGEPESVLGGEGPPKPSPFTETGELREGRFDVGPDDGYGLTGHYLGRISLHRDTITVQVESGLVKNRIIPDGPQMLLLGIRLGLRSWIDSGEEELVAVGEAEEFQIDLASGEQKVVGAFELTVGYDPELPFAQKLIFIHEIQMDDGRRVRTFTLFPVTMGDLIRGESEGGPHGSSRRSTPAQGGAGAYLTPSPERLQNLRP